MRPLLISGPSGVGKSYIADFLTKNLDYARVVPITTREPRLGEVNGVSYNFVNLQEYNEIENSGELFMSNDFFSARYGFQTSEVTKIIDQGFRPVTEIYTPKLIQFLSAFPDSDTLFLMPKSLEFLSERMQRRGDRSDKIEQRIAEAELEIKIFNEQASHLYRNVITIESDSQLREIIETILRTRELRDFGMKSTLK